MVKLTNLKLKRIDLKKADKHNHPNVKTDGTYYVARIDERLKLGTFSKQWFGLHFNCGWGMCGIQFDAPGTNHSDWKELWEVIGFKL